MYQNPYTDKVALAIARQYKEDFIEAIKAKPDGAVFYIDRDGNETVLTRAEFAALPIGPALDRMRALISIGLSEGYLFALQEPDRSTAFVHLGFEERHPGSQAVPV